MSPHKFSLTLGDWSGDGHSNRVNFIVECDLPVKEAREAFFAAKEKLPPETHPDNICSGYEETRIPKATLAKLRALGMPLPAEDEDFGLTTEDLADWTCWFINQGNPAVNARLVLDLLPDFHFWGYDDKGRHIGQIGYGLMSYG